MTNVQATVILILCLLGTAAFARMCYKIDEMTTPRSARLKNIGVILAGGGFIVLLIGWGAVADESFKPYWYTWGVGCIVMALYAGWHGRKARLAEESAKRAEERATNGRKHRSTRPV